MAEKDVSFAGLAAMCPALRPWTLDMSRLLSSLAEKWGYRPSFIVRGSIANGYTKILLKELREGGEVA